MEPTLAIDAPLPGSAYPGVYLATDAAASAAQRAYRRVVMLELALLLLGAVTATLAALLPELGSLMPSLVAAAFLAAMVLKVVSRRAGFDARWFDGRSIAEVVKGLTWRYMMRVAPFEGEHADMEFTTRITQLLSSEPSLPTALVASPAGREQITREMRRVREMPLAARRDRFRAWRIGEQAEWYRQQSRRHRRHGNYWFWFQFAAEVAGLGIGAASILERAFNQWNLVGLVAALAAAATAWSQLHRHDELGKTYGRAFQELLLLDDAVRRVDSEEALAAAVDRGEGILAREHAMWMARVARRNAIDPARG